MFTQNDYEILKAIIDKIDGKKGVTPTSGTTKKEIIEKTGLSMTKITNSLLSFEAKGIITPALKVKNAKSYMFTKEGFNIYCGLKYRFGEEQNYVK